MNNYRIAVGVLLCSVLISSVSQIMLKVSANKTWPDRLAEYFNPMVILSYVPLSMSPILESTSYIFVSIMGYFLLKEKFSKRKLTGLGLILVGIFVFSF